MEPCVSFRVISSLTTVIYEAKQAKRYQGVYKFELVQYIYMYVLYMDVHVP